MDVVEDLADDGGIRHICDYPQPTTALWAARDIELEDPLQRYVTRRWAHVSGAVGGSLSSIMLLFGGWVPSSPHDGVFPMRRLI